MNYDMPRVCFVIPSFGLGGTERQLLRLMKGLSYDHEIMVICTRKEGAMAGDARRLAKVHILGMRSGWDLRTGGRVGKLFRAYRPDLVHTFMFGFDKAVNDAARKTGVAVVISSRRQLATWKEPRHLRLQREANKLVDCIVANSHAVAEFAIKQEGANPDLFQVIHGGVDTEQFQIDFDPGIVRQRYSLPFHTNIIGMVANLSPVKDHALFVAMAAELARRRPDVHFVSIGNGSIVDSMGQAIEKAGLSGRITSLASEAELPYLYKLMSVSVLCSKAEGFPNVVMESMASETPVVAAAVGGIPELIEEGDTGKLVRSRDPSDFADAVEWVLDNPKDAKAMAARALQRVTTQFSVARMVDGYRRLYGELLAAKGRAVRTL